MIKKRKDIDKKDRWNVEAVFPTNDEWEKEFNIYKEEIKKIEDYKGRLGESAQLLKEAVETDLKIDRALNKLYIYAHMKHDEDTKDEAYRSMFERIYTLFTHYTELISWFTPELMSLSDETIQNYVNSNILKEYEFMLQKIIRQKPHTLSDKEERILSMSSNPLAAVEDAFRSMNDADLKFGSFTDDEGNTYDITHSKYYLYLINKKREIREKAFKQYHNKFDEFATTMGSLLYGKVKSDIFYARARNYDSALDAALFGKNIDKSVYMNLIKAVRERIGSLHNYYSFRKKKMGLDEFHLYDQYVPFVEHDEIDIDYNEAKDILFKSIEPLGDEYNASIIKGINEQRWVDIYENENKRSGAYSTGCYDTNPYILMNYNNTLNAARTLAHEAGHSMHSYFTRKYQPVQYGSYPIFLAEVASTFNEELFNNYMINKSDDDLTKAYLINSRIDEIKATLFRQTMFAEFELKIHELVEAGVPLTNQLLKKEYRELNEFYFGKDVVIDNEIEIEWARIPHFYYNFYVYQYATGISAAISLYKTVTNGGEKERDDYLGFLKAGYSKYPIDILKDAGVDMSTPKPVYDAIDYFDSLLEELKILLK